MPAVKRKRTITARRREQNRDAQKTYRAKIRDRLMQLETLQQTTTVDSDLRIRDDDTAIEMNHQHPSTGSSDVATSGASHDEPTKEPSPSTPSTVPRPHKLTPTQTFTVRPYTSDPLMNHLSGPHISLISAGVENSLLINLTQTQALTPGFPSPFFNLSSTSGTPTRRPSWFTTIPPDLFPTPLQLSTPHQAWLDSIPIPSFRDGALAYLTAERASNDQADLSELAQDIDNGGLVCWGGEETGTPWDARSWEARPWFLVKWSQITGGPQGELGQASAWWWRLKGEKFRCED